MKTKVAAVCAVFLLVASLGLILADWLDDLNKRTMEVVSAVNENAGQVNDFATNVNMLGKILKNLDPDSFEEE